MTEGSCLCGTVRWRIAGTVGEMSHCHCSMCRKAHAAPFATYVTALRSAFDYLTGEDAVTDYESSPGFHRAFCSRCGSVVPSTANGDEVYVPAGVLDGDPGLRPTLHIFVASRAPWYEIPDELPRYDAYPEGSALKVITREARHSGSAGVLAGSCLCGGVAFEVTEPFRVVHNCHCSRCRKARAAAHTTNGFTSEKGLRFLRGEDLVVSYKVPEARFFRQSFCRVCGAGLPRADAERGIAVTPLGVLDDDPGVGAGRHIFTAYKAPWFEIADTLPQFPERPPAS
jgi:hypothetical protein